MVAVDFLRAVIALSTINARALRKQANAQIFRAGASEVVMTYLSRLLAVTLVLTLSIAAAHAAPTEAEQAIAVRLLVEGRARYDAGQFSAALALFKRAHEIMHAPTTGLDLAKAYEALGRLVEARKIANEVINIPIAPNEKPIFAEARADAQRAIKALDSRIPRLRVQVVEPPIHDVHVEIDGNTLTVEEVDKGYAVDPGDHNIVVRALTYESFEIKVNAVESSGVVPVNVVLTPAPPTLRVPPGPVKPKPASDSGKTVNRSLVIGLSGGGLLLAGLGTGVVAGTTYQTMRDAKENYDRVNQSFCDVECMAYRKGYQDRQPMLPPLTIATTALGVLGAGAVLFAILDKPRQPKSKASLLVFPTPGGAMLQGVW